MEFVQKCFIALFLERIVHFRDWMHSLWKLSFNPHNHWRKKKTIIGANSRFISQDSILIPLIKSSHLINFEQKRVDSKCIWELMLMPWITPMISSSKMQDARCWRSVGILKSRNHRLVTSGHSLVIESFAICEMLFSRWNLLPAYSGYYSTVILDFGIVDIF